MGRDRALRNHLPQETSQGATFCSHRSEFICYSPDNEILHRLYYLSVLFIKEQLENREHIFFFLYWIWDLGPCTLSLRSHPKSQKIYVVFPRNP